MRQSSQRSKSAGPPLSTIRVHYSSDQHPLIDVLMKGLDDAVIAAVPIGFNRVELAVIASETNRVYGQNKALSFEPFSDDDPIMQRPRDAGETLDNFKARVGSTIFEKYRTEFLRTYSTQTNILVWAWFDSRIRQLNSRLGTSMAKFTLRRIFFPAAQPALKCLLLLAEASSDTSILKDASPLLIDRKLAAYDERVDDIIAAIAMEQDQESLAKLAVITWTFDASQYPKPSASLFKFLSVLTESSTPTPSIIYRQYREAFVVSTKNIDIQAEEI